MRPSVAILSLSLRVLAALAALHQRPTSVHGESQQQLISLFFDNLSWFLPEVTPGDLLPPAYATDSTKPIVAQ